MFHKIDLEGARAFVLAHADELGKARLAGILDGARPVKEVVKALESCQRPDGGFQRGYAAALGERLTANADAGASVGSAETAALPSSLDATCLLVDQLRDLPPLPGSPMASRALSFLRRAQNWDGSWSEEGAQWLAGEEGTAYLTANVAFTLLTLDPTNRDPITWGLKWLSERIGQGAHTQTLYLTWATAYRYEGPESALAAKAWSHLEPRLEEIAPEDHPWFLSAALVAGVGGRYLPAIARSLDRLAANQQPDGAWPAEMDRTAVTLTALRVLRGYALI